MRKYHIAHSDGAARASGVRTLTRSLLIVIGVLLVGCGRQPTSTPVPPAAPSLPPTESSGSQATRPQQGNAASQTLLAEGRSQGLLQGHSATVDCLHGERAQTDGNELRCEDWSYVRQNYLQTR